MPPPTRRSKRVRHPLVIVGNAIFTRADRDLGRRRRRALSSASSASRRPARSPQDKVVNIPRGLGIRDIADLLVREGVIDQPWVFIGGVLVLKARDELKYGEYQFTKHASLADVVDTIIEGKVVQHAFTMPEGLTSEQIVPRLLENDVLTGNIREIPREGTLLPETYKFTRGTTREQMIQRMQQAHKRVLQEIWERRMPDLPIKTPEQLVTLASIVEKETGKPEERTRVAAVFVNRLKTEDEAAIRSDHHLRPGRRQGLARPADHAQRDRAADALQHLCDRRPAAGPDRQSGPRLARGRRQSGAHQGTVFRRRRHRRPRLRRQLRAAPEERRAAARDRAAGNDARRRAPVAARDATPAADRNGAYDRRPAPADL